MKGEAAASSVATSRATPPPAGGTDAHPKAHGPPQKKAVTGKAVAGKAVTGKATQRKKKVTPTASGTV